MRHDMTHIHAERSLVVRSIGGNLGNQLLKVFSRLTEFVEEERPRNRIIDCIYHVVLRPSRFSNSLRAPYPAPRCRQGRRSRLHCLGVSGKEA
jgi:hypothetical protein